MKNKENITLKGAQISKLISWMFDKVILHGDIWMDWWNTEGRDSFFKYAHAKGVKYLEENYGKKG